MKRKGGNNEAPEEKRRTRPLVYRFLRLVYRKIPLSGGLRYSLRRFVRGLFSEERRVGYQTWIKLSRTCCQSERKEVEKKIQSLKSRPTFSFMVVIVEGIPPGLPRLVKSLLAQIYPRWELLILSPATLEKSRILKDFPDERIRHLDLPEKLLNISDCLACSLEQATGQFLGILGSEDSLSESALAEMVSALEENPKWRLVYTDEDCVDNEGIRHSPFFKPDFSPELLLSQNYLGDLAFYRRDRLREILATGPLFEKAERFDLNLRFVTRLDSSQIGHIPKVLYHSYDPARPRIGKSLSDIPLPRKFTPSPEGEKVLKSHLDRRRIEAQVEIGPKRVSYRMQGKFKDSPKVTIVMPSACKLSILKPCLESLWARTKYREFEVLLVVNEIRYLVPEQAKFLDGIKNNPGIRILVYEDQPFNYSKLNNWAIQHSDAPFVCLLNDDTEVMSRDWLSEMVFWSRQEGIGAVGAKLLYPDGRIQHAGVFLGSEGGLHAFRFFPGDSDGYMGRLQAVCNYSAVTGACLLIRRELYDRVGGLDEEAFPVAFNDIDLCLKLGLKGYRTVWTPFAELIHKESVSRGFDDTPEKEERFLKEFEVFKMRWGRVMEDDPLYNPNLSLLSEDFSLTFPPRKRGFCLGES